MQSAGQLCRGRWIKEPDREIEEGESCQPDSSVCCCMEREGGREGKKIKPNGFLKCAPARHTAALGVRGGDEQFAKSSICPPTQPPLPPSLSSPYLHLVWRCLQLWLGSRREGGRERMRAELTSPPCLFRRSHVSGRRLGIEPQPKTDKAPGSQRKLVKAEPSNRARSWSQTMDNYRWYYRDQPGKGKFATSL